MPKRMTPPNESIGAFQFPWPFGWVSAGFGMIWTKKAGGGLKREKPDGISGTGHELF